MLGRGETRAAGLLDDGSVRSTDCEVTSSIGIGTPAGRGLVYAAGFGVAPGRGLGLPADRVLGGLADAGLGPGIEGGGAILGARAFPRTRRSLLACEGDGSSGLVLSPDSSPIEPHYCATNATLRATGSRSEKTTRRGVQRRQIGGRPSTTPGARRSRGPSYWRPRHPTFRGPSLPWRGPKVARFPRSPV